MNMPGSPGPATSISTGIGSCSPDLPGESGFSFDLRIAEDLRIFFSSLGTEDVFKMDFRAVPPCLALISGDVWDVTAESFGGGSGGSSRAADIAREGEAIITDDPARGEYAGAGHGHVVTGIGY